MSQKEEKYSGLGVSQRQGEDSDRMIKRFLKKVRNDGIIQEIFQRRYYEKPSVRRRRKQSKNSFLRITEK